MTQTVDEGVAALVAATNEVAELESRLEVAKANKLRLEREVLPPIFDLAACKKFVYRPTGQTAKIGTIVTGSLPKATDDNPAARSDAIDYALSIGGEEFVQSIVTASWSRGEREKAVAVYNNLRRSDNSAKVGIDETIHHMTLKSWVKRRVAAGQPTNLDALGCDVFSAVTLSKARSTSHDSEEA